MKQYDAIIIGMGQAGPPLANALTKNGKKVAAVEGYKIGGSCVNYGCTPTKTLIASARVAHLARRGAEYGVLTGSVDIDFNQVMRRTNERRDSSHNSLESWLGEMENLDLYRVYAHFEGTKDGLHHVSLDNEVVAASKVFINTGTRARIPDIPGLASVPYLDNKAILNLNQLPRHLITLGGGYISLEMGQAFRRLGSEVTFIEAEETILKKEDDDIIQAAMEILQNESIRIYTGHKIVEVSQNANEAIIVKTQNKQGEQTLITGSHLLVAIGRIPNSDKLNLEAVGVNTDSRGYIQTDDHLQTNIPGIWALGDVNGRGAFTHTSYQDAEIVIDNLDGGTRSVKDRIMAYNLYIDPPLGRVGMSEKQARKSDRKVLMAAMPMNQVSRALEQGETQGLIKLLVDAETEQFLGAAVFGFHGDDVIQIISYFMHTGASYKIMKNALPIHPTIGEYLPTILGELRPLS